VSDVSRRAKSLGLSVHIQCGDAANLALEKGETFDFIKASQIIEHLIDPVGFVDSMSGLLSSDGYLYLECPNNSAAFLQIKNRLRRRFRRMDFYNSLRIKQHLWGFNRASMTELLRAHGYDIVFCRDYPVRHSYLQPENRLWYPSLISGASQSFSRGQPYALLKSLIVIFDWAASLTLSGGLGLAALGRKHTTAG
jgi:SAM-dependent methyltransferase